MAPRLRSAVVRFNALPELVWRVIMHALPVDARARAACVCRAWRAFMADSSLWQVLDLTPAGGVAAERVTENLVRGAVARAGGQLRIFCLNRAPDLNELLLEVFASNGAGLQQVNTDFIFSDVELVAVFAIAPRLQVLNAGVVGGCTELIPMLRNEPPYGPLRISKLHVALDEPTVDILALAAAVAAHESLIGLDVAGVDFARGVTALVNAATERHLSWLEVSECVLDAEFIPALARLLQRGSLTKLEVYNCVWFHNAEESVPVLCAALRACTTLKHLRLGLHPHNGASQRNITELLDAVAALPTLSVLDFWGGTMLDTAAFGHALGALLAANLPSLRALRVGYCNLGDEGLAPILDGLAANTHLRELSCFYNQPSEAFQRDRLVPALAALAARAVLDE